MLKIIKDSTLVPTPIVDLKLDSEPRQGSTDPVTSEGVKSAIDGAVGNASEALQEQIDEIAEKAGSGYIPKGEATVATLNALSGHENGELYTMTDAGTLTDGSLAVVAGDTVAWDATNEVWYKAMDYAPRQYGTNEVHNLPTAITAFRTGDVIPVDGPSGTAKMSKDDLLREAAENAVGSIHSLSDTATESDLIAGNYLAIDGSAGAKKLPAVILENKIVVGLNLINKDALSDLGEWCNYTNGKIESNSYVTAYRHTPYIEVKPSTYYSKRYNTGSAGTSFFDVNLQFISGVQTDVFQTPATCRYVIVNINTNIETVNAALLEEGNKTINYSQSVYPTPKYYNDFKYPNPAYEEVIINRGEASVATINALTFKYDGWKFFVTDSGTLTAGSVSVVAGDSVVWRSASAKWEKLNEFVSVIENNKMIAKIPAFTTGANLINKDALSDLGEWCNYTNGKIESNSYVTAYRHTPYIEVKPSTYYSKRYNTGSAGTSFFDSDMKFISGVQANIFQTPANCQYVIVNINTGIEPINAALLEEGNKTINYSQSVYPTPKYYNDFKYSNPAYSEKDFVTVGASDSDFTTIKEAFAYAVANDKYVIIKPGVYDLVQEGISGNGYILPKKVIGYGAKLVCHLDSENWNLSPLNTDYRYDGFEVYGLTIECSNCRYCIHDEMGARTSGAYHNVFKDLHLIHQSVASETLIAPNNIGGGFGDCGYIEIINCVFEAAYTKNIDYHSSFTESQNNDGTIQCNGCKFDKTFTMTSIGSSESFNNSLYVSNCLFGTDVPQSGKGRNVEIHSWNNVLQTN